MELQQRVSVILILRTIGVFRSMKFYRFMIGIRFNHKAFRLANNMGEIADELLSAKEGSFESITQSREDLERMHLSLFDNDHNSVLTLTNSDIVFKRKSEQGSDISPSLAIREFRDYWKIINKVMRFGTVRRIGLVSEFRVTPPEGVKDISKFLAERLTKIPVPTESKRFRLSYSDRERVEGNSPALINEGIDEFWNSIF